MNHNNGYSPYSNNLQHYTQSQRKENQDTYLNKWYQPAPQSWQIPEITYNTVDINTIKLEDFEQAARTSSPYSYGQIIRYNSNPKIKFSRMKASLFKQGILHACESSGPLYTTDLDPCVAVMIVKNGKAFAMHIDEYQPRAKNKIFEFLQRNDHKASIGIVGSNFPGSSVKVLYILNDLKEAGFLSSVELVSTQNRHSSALCIPSEQSNGGNIFYVGKE